MLSLYLRAPKLGGILIIHLIMVFGLKDEELALQNENDDRNDRASLTNLVDQRLTDINQDSKSYEVGSL